MRPRGSGTIIDKNKEINGGDKKKGEIGKKKVIK